jgi:mutator protein MutT
VNHFLLERIATIIQRNQYIQLSGYGLRKSAILIPFGIVQDVLCVLYTRRSHEVRHHAGQISFPGGKLERGETAWEGALRETLEEVGIANDQISFLGRIDDVISPKGFHIQCMAGWVHDITLDLDASEVEKVFWVPVSELLNPALHEVKPWKAFPTIDVHYFHFSSCLVWGVTGKMTFVLSELLRRLENVWNIP